MSPFHCDRHGRAVTHAGHCPACLLEVALTPEVGDGDDSSRHANDDRRDATRRVTICLPLGSSAQASVFLVRDDQAKGRLLRLKVWHAPAAAGFLDRFHELQVRLDRYRGGLIALPLTASVDAGGSPVVLSEFRQGVPLLDSARAGTVDATQLRAIMRPLAGAILSAHAAGLAHGSIVSGNVLVQPASKTAHLLDFGLTAVLNPASEHLSLVRADRHCLAALTRSARRLCPRSTRSEPTL